MPNQDIISNIKTLIRKNDRDGLFALLPGTMFYKEAIEEAAKEGDMALVGELFERLGFNINGSEFTFAQQALLNQALSGCAMGLHFELIKPLVEKGANIVFAVNALISVSGLTDENITQLQACVKGTAQDSKLQEALGVYQTIASLSN